MVEPRRSALIIAADDYADAKLRRLRAPVRDAEALGRVLADETIGGFEVETVLNEPEYIVRRKLAQFFANRNRDDLLLVHFSCHGLKDDDGRLYFATPDTEMEHLDSTAVPSEFVNRQMHRSRSRRIALFLDCCYSGAFSRGAFARAGEGVELAERFDGQGQVVITASNAMEYAFEGDELTGEGRPSVFTTALVEGLESGSADRDGDDLVSIDELYDYVYDRVRETTPAQTPSKWTYDLQGELYIARNPNPRPVSPTELPSDLRNALESPLAGLRLGAVNELERVLAGTNARLASAARLALKTLTADDSRSVSDAAASALARRSSDVDIRSRVLQDPAELAEPARPREPQVRQQLSGESPAVPEPTGARSRERSPHPAARPAAATPARRSFLSRIAFGAVEPSAARPTWWAIALRSLPALNPLRVALIFAAAGLLLFLGTRGTPAYTNLGESPLNRLGTLTIGAGVVVAVALAASRLLFSWAASFVVALALQEALGAAATVAVEISRDGDFIPNRHRYVIGAAAAMALAAGAAALTFRHNFGRLRHTWSLGVPLLVASIGAAIAFMPLLFSPLTADAGGEAEPLFYENPWYRLEPIGIATAAAIGVLLVYRAAPRIAAGWLAGTAANSLLYAAGLAAFGSATFGEGNDVRPAGLALFATGALLAAASALAKE